MFKSMKILNEEIERRNETINHLNVELACMRQRYKNEIYYKTQAEKEVAELKEKNKQLLKENVELLQQMRKILKEAKNDGRSQVD